MKVLLTKGTSTHSVTLTGVSLPVSLESPDSSTLGQQEAFPLRKSTFVFDVFSHMLASGARWWARVGSSHNESPRRIDPRIPEAPRTSKVHFCAFGILHLTPPPAKKHIGEGEVLFIYFCYLVITKKYKDVFSQFYSKNFMKNILFDNLNRVEYLRFNLTLILCFIRGVNSNFESKINFLDKKTSVFQNKSIYLYLLSLIMLERFIKHINYLEN